MLWISISIRTATKLNKVFERLTTSYETITDADSAIRGLELTKVSDKPTSIVQKRASIVNVDKDGNNDGNWLYSAENSMGRKKQANEMHP